LILEQHAEFVAAEARDGIAGAQARGNPLAYDHEDVVADEMAERVVDL
jgi:hypothetical protein